MGGRVVPLFDQGASSNEGVAKIPSLGDGVGKVLSVMWCVV